MSCPITELHDQRLGAVLRALLASNARSVLDLGCGSGALLQRLVQEPQFERIVGVDWCGTSLYEARDALREHLAAEPDRLSIIAASYTARDAALQGFDACGMIETIEHVAPKMLGAVEETVFGYYRPRTLVMTTPNAEFNELLGLARHEFRHPAHRFEWDSAKFRAWATGVARRNGYRVRLSGIGAFHVVVGQPTQMAIFSRTLEHA